MKIISKTLLVLSFATISLFTYGQGYISSDYMTSSSLKDENGNGYGSGDLLILSGRYTLPFAIKHNHRGQPIAWSATLYCSYGISHNKGQAKDLNPGNIVNSSLNISHIRPISEKWNIIASIGAGVYASPNEITSQSILANGGIIFAYKLRKLKVLCMHTIYSLMQVNKKTISS